MGIASLILGIVALVLCWFGVFTFAMGWLPLLCGILAIVFGIIQIVKSKKTENSKGKGKAIAGIIMGGIGLIAALIFSIFSTITASRVLEEISDYDFDDYDFDYSTFDLDY